MVGSQVHLLSVEVVDLSMEERENIYIRYFPTP